MLNIKHTFLRGDHMRISDFSNQEYHEICQKMIEQGINAYEYGHSEYDEAGRSDYNFFGVDHSDDIVHYDFSVSYDEYDSGGGYYRLLSRDDVFGVTEKTEVASDQWDTATRGEKMSSASGKVIFKYQMPVLEEFTMKLPRGAEIIRMADQGGMFWLWAVVDTNLPDETRLFHAVKCGANVPDKPNLHYHGFCAIFVQQELGLYIFEDMDHGKNT